MWVIPAIYREKGQWSLENIARFPLILGPKHLVDAHYQNGQVFILSKNSVYCYRLGRQKRLKEGCMTKIQKIIYQMNIPLVSSVECSRKRIFTTSFAISGLFVCGALRLRTGAVLRTIDIKSQQRLPDYQYKTEKWEDTCAKILVNSKDDFIMINGPSIHRFSPPILNQPLQICETIQNEKSSQ
jgi:hypothetical protein